MKKKSSIYLDILSHVLLVGATIVAVFPLVWIIISSVKGKGELTQYPTRFWPEQFTLDYFTHVINDLHFIDNIRNSLIIALATTLIAIIISAMAAYGIVRFFPKLGAIMSRLLVITYIFPPILLAIPYSIAIAKVGLTNSLFGLMMVYLSFSVPYAVWLLVGFFQTVPIGIEEAARIDGANKFVTFYKVVLPIVAPGIVATGIVATGIVATGIVATAIYTFINAWNEFLYALILINNTGKMTVAVALRSLNGSEILDWGDMMAASVIVVLPSIIFFSIIQNKIASGLSEGSVK
ncbi:TPA: carbohydrate ABC transporter permease [Streptococcus pneumoniae]|nr:carbohydrate ABC transporter permease [Streptococcus pneumoniae]